MLKSIPYTFKITQWNSDEVERKWDMYIWYKNVERLHLSCSCTNLSLYDNREDWIGKWAVNVQKKLITLIYDFLFRHYNGSELQRLTNKTLHSELPSSHGLQDYSNSMSVRCFRYPQKYWKHTEMLVLGFILHDWNSVTCPVDLLLFWDSIDEELYSKRIDKLQQAFEILLWSIFFKWKLF